MNPTSSNTGVIASTLTSRHPATENETHGGSGNYYKTHTDNNRSGASAASANNSNLLDAIPYGNEIDDKNKSVALHSLTNTDLLTGTDQASDGNNANDMQVTTQSDTHRQTHTGKKQNQCDTCGRFFSSKNYLDTHIRTHTGEKPYQCDLCQKNFYPLAT